MTTTHAREKEGEKRRPAILEFRKSILRKVSNDRLVTRIKGRLFFAARVAYRRTRRVKKKELSIKGRPFLLCKKCLNVICVRVWPGYDETVVAAGSNQAGRRERNEGGGDRKGGDGDIQA